MDATELPPHPSLEQYKKQAKELNKLCQSAQPEALQRITRNHPRFRKLPESQLLSLSFTLSDAQLTIAREHGFESWPKFAKHIEAMAHMNSPVSEFESAADAVVTGDVATLELLLRDHPNLVRARSTREHRATLLHYVAANGVEDYRQKTPRNAVTIAETLLNSGAEVDAPAETYGGGTTQTTLNLLVSSTHPSKAGVQVALVDTLLDHGAAVNGIDGDSSPLLTALAFHYADAAEALVRRGASIDSIVAAAALGRQELVEKFLNAENAPRPEAETLQVAFVWAAMHRRLPVLEFLLRKRIDPGARDRRGWTALHWAAYYAYPDIVELLLKWNAPLEIENEFGGTALNQTVWTTVHEHLQPDHPLVIKMLLDAGAKVDGGWLRADLRPSLQPRIAEVLRGNVPHP